MHVCVVCVCVCVCACVCVCVCVHGCVCYVHIHVPLLSSGSGISGQVPVLYTWQYHTCDKYCITIPVAGVAGGVAGGGVSLILLLVLVVAIILVIHRRDSLKKSHQMDALMMQMETLETNMAEECKRGNVTSV